MTKGIKVWIAVNPSQQSTEHISFLNGDGAILLAAQWHNIPIEVDTIGRMKALGWTVEPYTLTRGHSDE